MRGLPASAETAIGAGIAAKAQASAILKIYRAQQFGGFHDREAQEHAGRTEQHR